MAQNAPVSLMRSAVNLIRLVYPAHQYAYSAYFSTKQNRGLRMYMQRARLIVHSKLFTNNEKQSEKQSVYRISQALLSPLGRR